MNQPKQTVVKLAAMECAASCLMTYLQMKGMSYRYFLMNYWSLVYDSKLIMSGKKVRLYRLDYFYGIRSELKKGTKDDLIHLLHSGSMAMLMCKTTNLNYFPRELMTHEGNGIRHFILIKGYDQDKDEFLVADPTADFTGRITSAQLSKAGADRKDSDSMYYHTLEPPSSSDFVSPDPKEAFHYAASQNLQLYVKSDHNFGRKAIDKFSEELVQSANWNKELRDQWIFQNNITISSIVKTRAAVWNSFREMHMMSPSQIEEGNSWIDSIVKLWTTVNFLLIKYKKNSDTHLLESLLEKLEEIKQREIQFLTKIEQIGSELREI